MTKLDEIAINTELVLVSLIEGVALVTLAENAVEVLHTADWLRFLPYVFGGLAILLVFWAQSILHAVSFIRWPIRVEHIFLYFAAAFLQVLAYSSLTNMTMWFFWWSVFSLLVVGMYALDLRIIRDSRATFAEEDKKDFLASVETRHLYEMKYLVPFALAFNIVACVLSYFEPQLFISPLAYALPGLLQLLISLGALYDCTKNFRKRSLLIAKVSR